MTDHPARPALVDRESVRRTAQGYADFWGEQATKNKGRREHYEVLASQFQRLANHAYPVITHDR